MIAYYQAEMTKQNWEAHLQNEEHKKQEAKAGRK